jgi:predicted ATPase/DNA-binding SARP family transcriptional activator
MRYYLLGPLLVLGDDGGPVALGGQGERALLTVLLLNANRAVSAARLIDVLWGEGPPPTAVNALQAQVSRLRKKLAGPAGAKERLQGSPAGYRLEVGPGELDLGRFQELTARADRPAAELSAALAEALALWRGPALAGVSSDALAGEAARLEEMRMVALERRVEADLALGRHHVLVPELDALVHDHPLREGLRGQLMVALYRTGRQADALAAYREGRAVLAEELGIDPGPALQALEVAVLQQAPEVAAPPATPASAQPVTLAGEVEPAGPGRPSAGRHNLPQPLSSFIGREAETMALGRLVEAHRLAVVVGPGGVGKTRLALQVAAGQLERFEDGVWLVELASLRNPDLVANAVADALGVRQQPGRPVLATLLDALRHRRSLLVLDNCEHVVGSCAHAVEVLLGAGPGLSVLATSREPLGAEGEQVFRLGPLSTPVTGDEALDPTLLAKSDAVALFVERAAAQRPGFVLDGSNAAAVAGICARLDGIPLALELAAARLRSMSVHDIQARLADRFVVLTGARRTAPPRHQTLEALIGWSYDLLSPAEQAVFARLSVFAGGWRLEQAEQVCAGEAVTTAEVASLLSALVDKSLVEVEPTGPAARYRLLETVRQYAHQRLAEAEEAERTTRAHARAYLALAETAAPHLRGQAQAEWLVRIDEDLDNVRVAAATLLAAPDGAEEALRLVRAQRWYGDLRPRYGEDIEMAQAALGMPGADARTLLRAQALLTLLSLKNRTGDLAMVASTAEEGLAIARAHADSPTVVDLLIYRVYGAYCQGDRSPQILAMARECIDLARQCGDPHLAGRAWMTAPGVLEFSTALEYRRQAVTWVRGTGDRHWLSLALNTLADNEIGVGDLAAAKADLDEAIGMVESLGGENQNLAVLHFNAGLAAFLAGDASGAAARFSASFGVAERVGARLGQAASVFGLAWCASARGDAPRAAYLHGTAAAVSELLGQQRLPPLEAGITEKDMRKLQEELGPEAFEGAFSSGAQLARTWWQVDSRTRETAIFSTRAPG